MPDICILTDSTAQFTRPNFPGHAQVYVIPFHLQPDPRQEDKNLPRPASVARLIPPSPQEFLGYFTQLGLNNTTVLVLTLSSFLSSASQNAQGRGQAASPRHTMLYCPVTIHF